MSGLFQFKAPHHRNGLVCTQKLKNDRTITNDQAELSERPQKPPDEKERYDAQQNVTDPLSRRSRSAKVEHSGMVAVVAPGRRWLRSSVTRRWIRYPIPSCRQSARIVSQIIACAELITLIVARPVELDTLTRGSPHPIL